MGSTDDEMALQSVSSGRHSNRDTCHDLMDGTIPHYEEVRDLKNVDK